ncbi:hypothetical protein LR002_01855 [Candidatus Gracilibacteria bacterium]|nr:hypothetical protein [Candidatus Gracilibacteria bacterium]
MNTLIFSFSIQSFIAFYQVIFQAPVGLFFLGENNFGENLNGVAKIGDFIRGYGALSHPNILGLSSLILYFLARKSSLNFLKNLMIIGIFFSFSKTAIIGFFILKFYEKIFLHEEKKFFDLTNFFNPQKKFFYNKIKIFYTIFYSSIFFSIFFFVGDKILMRFQNFFGIGFQERILQFEIAEKIFVKNLENFNLFGIGFGNFTLQMQNFTDKILKPWEFQPVHNFFILFGTEVGIFGLTILLFLMSFLFFKSTKKPSEKIFLLLLLFFGSFFDHFLLSSTIGIILFWTILKNFNFFAKIPS